MRSTRRARGSRACTRCLFSRRPWRRGSEARGGRCFVVSANRAGLRQSFVEDGRLRFARLERVAEMVPQALAMFVRSETQRLAQYLATLRALPREGAPVQVIVVAPPGQEAVFEQVLVSDARLLFKTSTAPPRRARSACRRSPKARSRKACTCISRRRSRRATSSRAAPTRAASSSGSCSAAAIAAGAVAFAACALVAGSRWLDAHNLRDRAESQMRQSSLAADQYQRITPPFP